MLKFAHKARQTHTTWWLESKRKKKSNLLTFTLLGNTTLPFIKVATPLFPGIPANLPPPFFHTWLIRTRDHYLLKGWSPHFCSHGSWWHALPLLLLYFAAVPTLPFHSRWLKGIQCHPIMDLGVVQKHRDARPSVYVKKNKYLNYKCLCFFLTWDINGTIPRCVKMSTAPACNKVWERHLNLQI